MNELADVLIISNYFPPAELGGGPARTLDAMVASTRSPDRVAILTSHRDLGGRKLDILAGTWLVREGTRVLYVEDDRISNTLSELRRSAELRPRYVYLNSVFNTRYSILPLVFAKGRGWGAHTAVVIAPRGELDPGALAIKSTKKHLFLNLARRIGLFEGAIWHASSDDERRNIHKAFPGANVFVRPNETRLPPTPLRPNMADGPTIAHISRITPKKGLHILLEALQDFPSPLTLDIYGNEEDIRYSRECHRLAESTPQHVNIAFHGPLAHDQVRTTLVRYDAMALPTAGENFGHVIAESLSASCPVFLPDTTPWSSVARRLGTLVPDRNPATWREALLRQIADSRIHAELLRRRAGQEYQLWKSHEAEDGSTLDRLMSNTGPLGPTPISHKKPRLAIITQGYQTAGGVQAVARWLVSGLKADWTVKVFDLASSARDRNSMRILRPTTWFRGPRLRVSDTETGVWHVGCSGAEVEPMRYLPRSVLTRSLRQADVVQVVAGGPSLALAAVTAGRPVVLQVATRMRWERQALRARRAGLRSIWDAAMAFAVDHMETRALRQVNAVLVENKVMAAYVRRVAPCTPCVLAPPGIDTETFSPGAPWDASGPIVTVGRLNDPRKGFERALLAYRALRMADPATPHLIIIGRGNGASLLARAEALGLTPEAVSVVSDASEHDLVTYLRSSSVFWQTSYEEGLGIAVLEAMACGLPVVSTRTAGSETTVVENVTGHLVDQDEQFEWAMVEATRSIWAGAGHHMSVQGRARAVELFSIEATLRAFTDTYEMVLRDHSDTRALTMLSRARSAWLSD